MRAFCAKMTAPRVIGTSIAVLLVASVLELLPAFAAGLRAGIVTSNGQVIVSWPVSPITTTLETAEMGLFSQWTPVTNIPAAVESNLSVALPKVENGAMFRLATSGSIPIFQFGAFYDLDYECAALPAATFDGAVHCNADTYLTPHTGITYRKSVTSAGNVLRTAKPGNVIGGTGPVTNLSGWRAGAERLGLAIGTNSLRQIVEIPPPTEDPLSPMGRHRFYNLAQMIILVSNMTLTVRSGRFNEFATEVINYDFVATNRSFYNGREGKRILCTDIDVGRFRAWKADPVRNNITYPWGPGSGADINVIYVADFRTTNATTQMGIRLRNGLTLPPGGLTIVSPHPVYILGHYNCPNAAHLGTTNTTATAPAAVVGDALTILSSAWNDNGGLALALNDRVPLPTTINAALVSGIVQTSTNSGYSGGIENYLRLLEDWSNNKVLTYNGSMVVLYESMHAVRPWNAIGVYYNPPIRNWNFDPSLLQWSRLPPGTPLVTWKPSD